MLLGVGYRCCKMLQMLFQCLVSNELKQIMIGHSLVQAVKPKSVIFPILLGIAAIIALSFILHWHRLHFWTSTRYPCI